MNGIPFSYFLTPRAGFACEPHGPDASGQSRGGNHTQRHTETHDLGILICLFVCLFAYFAGLGWLFFY